jgi:glycolate oxidase FAD binding subunit
MSLRERFRPQGLSVIVDAAPPALKAELDIWGGTDEGLEIMREIKRRFDPKATLSPGRFVGGI